MDYLFAVFAPGPDRLKSRAVRVDDVHVTAENDTEAQSVAWTYIATEYQVTVAEAKDFYAIVQLKP